MRPRRTHHSNRVYRLAGGTEDSDLWVEETHDSEHPAVPVICSVWELTDEEREAIAAGANIELAVWGSQPPVALQTTTVTLGRAPELCSVCKEGERSRRDLCELCWEKAEDWLRDEERGESSEAQADL